MIKINQLGRAASAILLFVAHQSTAIAVGHAINAEQFEELDNAYPSHRDIYAAAGTPIFANDLAEPARADIWPGANHRGVARRTKAKSSKAEQKGRKGEGKKGGASKKGEGKKGGGKKGQGRVKETKSKGRGRSARRPPTSRPTPSPSTASPTTPSPTTVSPTTASPTTTSPTTSRPTTASPTLASAPTATPTTAAPTTGAPSTSAPTTVGPTVAAGSPSASPTTSAPTTARPTTASPTTPSPTSASPTTSAPTTAGPTATAGSSSPAPTSSSPTTATPTTGAPTTAGPTTASPTTGAPTTGTPTTASPTTTAPTTAAPTAATAQIRTVAVSATAKSKNQLATSPPTTVQECTENPRYYTLSLDIQMHFLDHNGVAPSCQDDGHLASIAQNTQSALNDNFAATVKDWHGKAIFGEFVMDPNQMVDNLDNAGLLRRRLRGTNTDVRSLQGGLCPSRSVDCSSDACLWGCLEVATTDCGNPRSSTTSWPISLAGDVQNRLASMGRSCLGISDQLRVVVTEPTVVQFSN